MKRFKELQEKRMRGPDPCWKGYQMIGKKTKNGKEVPNCVPESVEHVEEQHREKGRFHPTVPYNVPSVTVAQNRVPQEKSVKRKEMKVSEASDPVANIPASSAALTLPKKKAQIVKDVYKKAKSGKDKFESNPTFTSAVQPTATNSSY